LAAPVIDTRVLMGRHRVSDLQLVNLAASHGTRLVTFDIALRDALMPEDRDFVEVCSA